MRVGGGGGGGEGGHLFCLKNISSCIIITLKPE